MKIWTRYDRLEETEEEDKYIRTEILSNTKATVKTRLDRYNKYIAAVYKI